MRFKRLATALVALGSSGAWANVLTDPSFEGSDWSTNPATHAIVEEAANIRTGGRSLRVDSDGASNFSYHSSVPVTPGELYCTDSWVKAVALEAATGGDTPLQVVQHRDAGGAFVKRHNDGNAEGYRWAALTGGSPASYEFTNQGMQQCFEPADGAALIRLGVRSWSGNTAGTTYWEDMALVLQDRPDRGAVLQTLQAEDAATIIGGTVHSAGGVDTENNYTGTGYVEINTPDGALDWTVNHTGAVVLSVRYTREGPRVDIYAEVNGNEVARQNQVSPTGRKDIYATQDFKINITAGDTLRVRMTSKGGAGALSSPHFDKVTIYEDLNPETTPEPGSFDEILFTEWCGAYFSTEGRCRAEITALSVSNVTGNAFQVTATSNRVIDASNPMALVLLQTSDPTPDASSIYEQQSFSCTTNPCTVSGVGTALQNIRVAAQHFALARNGTVFVSSEFDMVGTFQSCTAVERQAALDINGGARLADAIVGSHGAAMNNVKDFDFVPSNVPDSGLNDTYDARLFWSGFYLADWWPGVKSDGEATTQAARDAATQALQDAAQHAHDNDLTLLFKPGGDYVVSKTLVMPDLVHGNGPENCGGVSPRTSSWTTDPDNPAQIRLAGVPSVDFSNPAAPRSMVSMLPYAGDGCPGRQNVDLNGEQWRTEPTNGFFMRFEHIKLVIGDNPENKAGAVALSMFTAQWSYVQHIETDWVGGFASIGDAGGRMGGVYNSLFVGGKNGVIAGDELVQFGVARGGPGKNYGGNVFQGQTDSVVWSSNGYPVFFGGNTILMDLNQGIPFRSKTDAEGASGFKSSSNSLVGIDNKIVHTGGAGQANPIFANDGLRTMSFVNTSVEGATLGAVAVTSDGAAVPGATSPAVNYVIDRYGAVNPEGPRNIVQASGGHHSEQMTAAAVHTYNYLNGAKTKATRWETTTDATISDAWMAAKYDPTVHNNGRWPSALRPDTRNLFFDLCVPPLGNQHVTDAINQAIQENPSVYVPSRFKLILDGSLVVTNEEFFSSNARQTRVYASETWETTDGQEPLFTTANDPDKGPWIEGFGAYWMGLSDVENRRHQFFNIRANHTYFGWMDMRQSRSENDANQYAIDKMVYSGNGGGIIRAVGDIVKFNTRGNNVTSWTFDGTTNRIVHQAANFEHFRRNYPMAVFQNVQNYEMHGFKSECNIPMAHVFNSSNLYFGGIAVGCPTNDGAPSLEFHNSTGYLLSGFGYARWSKTGPMVREVIAGQPDFDTDPVTDIGMLERGTYADD